MLSLVPHIIAQIGGWLRWNSDSRGRYWFRSFSCGSSGVGCGGSSNI